MGKHFPDGPVLFTLIVSIIAIGIASFAFDCDSDNRKRKGHEQSSQLIV